MHDELFAGVNAEVGALDAALRADGIGITGVSAGPYGIIVHLLSADDAGAAAGVVDAHDPVWISVDKTLISADGSDTATITVRAPKAGAAPVTLLVDGVSTPVMLTDGVGTLSVAAADPGVIDVSVEFPANRTTDTLEILAV